jgi:hypothetical protein
MPETRQSEPIMPAAERRRKKHFRPRNVHAALKTAAGRPARLDRGSGQDDWRCRFDRNRFFEVAPLSSVTRPASSAVACATSDAVASMNTHPTAAMSRLTKCVIAVSSSDSP